MKCERHSSARRFSARLSSTWHPPACLPSAAPLLLAAMLLIAGQAWMQPAHAQPAATPATPQKAFDDAKALGTAQAQTGGTRVRNGQAEGVLATTIPGYTANPPERQIYGRQDMTTATADMRAKCMAAPNDPVCRGAAVATQTRPPHNLTPASPVFAGQEAARDPNSVLGDIANTYNACSTGGTLQTPAKFERRSCGIDTTAWQNEPCTKTLSVSLAETTTCTPGAVLATATMGSGETSSVTAFCPAAGGTRIPFRFDARGLRGSCSGPLDVTIDLGAAQPVNGNVPASVGVIQPHWFGSCLPLRVHWSTPGCSAGQCQVTIDIVEEPSTVPVYACPAGTTIGSGITWYAEYPPQNAASACYAPFPDEEAAGGRPGARGAYGEGSAFWAEMSTAQQTGWQWGSGLRHQSTLSFAEPRRIPPSGDRWTNTCTSQEARTPLLPKDGITTQAPVMPVVGLAGQQQCVRTRSVCTDGPSTKNIDGVQVTRECWAYANEFACTSVAASSTCASATFQACSPAGAAGCSQLDAEGRCVSAAFGYDCKVSEAVFTPAVNCGVATFCAGGSCWDRTKTANAEFASSVSQLEAHMQAGLDMEVDGSSIQIFKGADRRCQISNLGIDNCCSDSAFIERCSAEQQQTYKLKQQGRCHELGEYCSNRTVLGICVERTRTACCFSSILSRVIQQQGRAQLAQGWGGVQSPDCTGFTPDEITALDWSLFDLSEFYASIHPTPLGQSSTQGAAQTRQPNCYYGQGRC